MNILRLNRKLVIGTVLAVVAVTAFVGWMHTPGARPILRKWGVPCPVDQVTAEQANALHERGLVGLRGTTMAPVRPAMGLDLDKTTEQDALAWAKTNAVNCDTVVRGYRYLRCRGVPPKAIGSDGAAISEMWFSFGVTGKLIGVDVYRRGLDAQGTVAAWSSATTRLKDALGDPSVHFGDPSPATLLASTLQTARVQYRYENYIATVTAVNLPQTGLAVREQYLSGSKQL